MQEIESIPSNGFVVASLFAGCGGSSLGYRMAGYRVVYANELVEIAARTYRANASPSCFVDCRSIRDVRPEDVLSACGLAPGQLDILDGSPPCDSFSTAGLRHRGWNRAKDYHGHRQRTDDLFWEYIRILRALRPRVFVAENVSGLVKGKAKGHFLEFLRAFLESGYRVDVRLLDAARLGVPQYRKRVIFVGVRNDLALDPPFPRPLSYVYTLRDAIDDIIERDYSFPLCPALVREWNHTLPGKNSKRIFSFKRSRWDQPVFAVCAIGGSSGCITHPDEPRRFTIQELKRLCSFPDDFVLFGKFAQRWERLGLSVPPLMIYHVAATIRDRVLIPIDPVPTT